MKRSLPAEGYHHSLGNSRYLPSLVRGAIALTVALAVLNCTVMAAPSARKAPNPSIGMVTVTGNVTINGSEARSGQSLFPTSTIVTSTDSESLIEFAGAARLKLAAQTNLTVDSSSERISGILNDGRLEGLLPAGVMLDFTTADSSITTSTAEPVVFSIQSGVCSGTTLSVQTGSVNIQAAGNLRTVKAGETFSTSPNSSAPQASRNSLNHRKRLGLLIGIGATIGIILGVVLGKSGKNQSPFGGCVIAPSGDGGPGQCS
jgi:hypothetical protein